MNLADWSDGAILVRDQQVVSEMGRSNKQAAPEKTPLSSERAADAAGKSATVQHRLLNELCETVWLPQNLDKEDQRKRIFAAIERLEKIEPRDAVESMLAVQMVATHNAAIECLRRAMLENQTFAGRDMALKHATKLLQVYERQLAALDKHRGKGQQKVTVEHVHVEAGGQAIVGNVDARRGDAARGRATVAPLPTPRAFPSILSRPRPSGCRLPRASGDERRPSQKCRPDDGKPALRRQDAGRQPLPRTGRLGQAPLPHAWRGGGLRGAARQPERLEARPLHKGGPC